MPRTNREKHSLLTVPVITLIVTPAMAWYDEWLDIPFLKFLSREASAAIGALLSYAIVGAVAVLVIRSETLTAFVESSEKAVLFMLFVYFPVRVGYHLYRLSREVRGHDGRH
jgi:hypothetical protein